MLMVTATINGIPVQCPEGTTILGAARRSGIAIPSLCGIKEVNEIGACRVCVVEVEGIERLVAACTALLEEGMVVRTDSPRVLESRRTNVALLLSQHDVACATCVRNDNRVLQSLAQELNIWAVP